MTVMKMTATRISCLPYVGFVREQAEQLAAAAEIAICSAYFSTGSGFVEAERQTPHLTSRSQEPAFGFWKQRACARAVELSSAWTRAWARMGLVSA